MGTEHQGILWVGGWVVGRERGDCLCPTANASAAWDVLKILSVCHTHVISLPHAEDAPQTSQHSSCSGAKLQ